VYFSCVRTGSAPLAAAARTLPRRGASIESALRSLFRGPTAAERRAGYRTTFGAATARLPFTVTRDPRHRLAVVDLDRRFLDVEFLFVPTEDVAQIVSTAGQFPGIEWVAILVENDPLCKALQEC
jgi:spore germination protein GerM